MDRANRKGPGTNRRKFRRSRPDSLGALSSLVSFDDAEAEAEASKDDCKNESQKRMTAAGQLTNTVFESDWKLTRIWSAPLPSGTLDGRGDLSLRKTLSQDWLKTKFSPRPGKEPRRGLMWGSDCLQPQRPLSNIPSLQSIPEESEVEHDDGSELSDENVIAEDDSCRRLVHGTQNKSVKSSIIDEHE